MSAAVFSAQRIAELLTEPGRRPLAPTDEQTRMIEQPLGGSVLVVAGAGSGKTETMANRVVWLVANGLAAPSDVLGLTFTRKAAGELGERIASRLGAFTERLLDADERGLVPPEEARRAAELRAVLGDGLELPEVSTYNAFAAGIVQEFGAFAGLPASVALIDEAAAWRLARRVVCESELPGLSAASESIASLVRRTIALDHAVSDNLTSFDRVEQIVEEFARVRELPYDDKALAAGTKGKDYKTVLDAVGAVEQTGLITALARRFAEEKRERGLIEFSDQLALAVQTIERYPAAARAVRERSPIVLLDEVQDTSVGQTRLLSRLFAGRSVMAVGDPNQSIYGWRGASADNLAAFHRDFAGPGDGGTTLSLSISWRNPGGILRAANAIVEPLNAKSPIEVPELRPKEAVIRPAEAAETRSPEERNEPNAASYADGIEVIFPETIDEEYERLAGWMRDARAEHLARTGEPATAAVVLRRRASMPAVAAALTAAGVPNRIVGVGGLLSTPEVTDVLSLMRCVWYADAGSELIRVLAGPRFRIGPADLAGLRDCAAWFSRRDASHQPLTPEDLDPGTALNDPDRTVTLIDALDEIAGLRDLDHASLRTVSELGRQRLRAAGRMLRGLRYAVGQGVLELIRSCAEALLIDIELDAHERNGYEGGAVARANLDAFTDLVERFLQTDEHGTLASVLAWLERVGESDQEAEHVPEPEPGTVQLITGHGAKGLEWDLVAIPRLVDREMPLPPKEGLGWLRPGELPDELRGDAAARPTLNWRLARTQAELRDEIGGFTRKIDGESRVVEGYATELAERQREEERRLAYVAVTRAASRLLLTGSYWAGHSAAREPSVYLQELAERGIIPEIPVQSAHDENPSTREERTATWPLDPLGARAEDVLRSAAIVRDRLAETEEVPNTRSDPAQSELSVDPVVQLLIAEREAAGEARGGSSGPGSPGTRGGSGGARLPERITASSFHEFVEDPEEAQRRILRPVPQRPYRRTRVGNLFHEWVERRATTARGTAVPLALDEFAASSPGEAEELAPLIENFERSRWAALQPIAVEQEVTLPFAGRRLVCKLDAVFRYGEGDEARYEVVDWKSGGSPRDESERISRFFQLDLYRHAYAQWAGVDTDRIDVALFYVAEGVELRGEHPRSLAELEELWGAAAARLGA